MTKCSSCKDRFDDDRLILLCESQLGFGSLSDYIVCVNCYNKFERDLDEDYEEIN